MKDKKIFQGSITIRLYLLFTLLLPSYVLAFGVSPFLGSQKEHATITRIALSCDSVFDPSTKPNNCFDQITGSNLYNYRMTDFASVSSTGSFSAVEAPDNLVWHQSGGPIWWHCDNGDYGDNKDYPQNKDKANHHVMMCRSWAQGLLGDGVPEKDYLCNGFSTGWLKGNSYSCDGVAEISHLMLNSKGQVSVNQPDFLGAWNLPGLGDCNFDGSGGRIKCRVLQQFGYALHTIQDFYSHSNYADMSYSPFNYDSPVGLGLTDVPSFWDLKVKDVSVLTIPLNLITGCFPDKDCNLRSTHTHLNKDHAPIQDNGLVGGPQSLNFSSKPRSDIIVDGIPNSQRAVTMAIKATRRAWVDLQALIIAKEGKVRGDLIICAITSDKPNQCTGSKSSSMAAIAKSTASSPKTFETLPEWEVKENKALFENGIIMFQFKTAAEVLGLPEWNICGSVKIDKIILPSLIVKGMTCNQAKNTLRKYRASMDNRNSKHKYKLPSGFACLALPMQPGYNPEEERVGILCKSDDPNFEIDYEPACPDRDCGY